MGHKHTYLLADRRVRLGYDAGRRRLNCRQVTRLDERTGHQTQIITTRLDLKAAEVAHGMFSRWREENYFRFLLAHYGLDALDSYEPVDDDAARLVPNPARRAADKAVREARAAIAKAEAIEGRRALSGDKAHQEIADAFSDARKELAAREAHAKSLPAKVRLGDARPGAKRLDGEHKRIHDAIRMATYNDAPIGCQGPVARFSYDLVPSMLASIFRGGAPKTPRITG